MNSEESITIKYYAKFEKTVAYIQKPNEELNQVMDRIGIDMDNHENDYLDGTFIEFSEPEVKE